MPKSRICAGAVFRSGVIGSGVLVAVSVDVVVRRRWYLLCVMHVVCEVRCGHEGQ